MCPRLEVYLAYLNSDLCSVKGFAEATAPFQYPDGPVIGASSLPPSSPLVLYILISFPAVQSENEYATTAQAHIPGLDEHMQDIINVLREGGITKVPTIHNDKNPAGQYAQPGLGKVDLYGWDGCVTLFFPAFVRRLPSFPSLLPSFILSTGVFWNSLSAREVGHGLTTTTQVPPRVRLRQAIDLDRVVHPYVLPFFFFIVPFISHS